jgi:hypothetical protein
MREVFIPAEHEQLLADELRHLVINRWSAEEWQRMRPRRPVSPLRHTAPLSREGIISYSRPGVVDELVG